MNRVSVKGVVLGGITDVVTTNLLSIPFAIYVIQSRGLMQLPKSQIGPAFVRTLHASPSLYAFALAIGMFCSVLGGYIAAKVAKHDAVVNGMLSAWLCIVVGAYALLHGSTTFSRFPVETPFSTLFATAGGYIAGRNWNHLSPATAG